MSVRFIGLPELACLRAIGAPPPMKVKATENNFPAELAKLGRISFDEKVVAADFMFLIALLFFQNPGFMTGFTVWFPNPGGKTYITSGGLALVAAFPLFIFPLHKKNKPERGNISPSSFVEMGDDDDGVLRFVPHVDDDDDDDDDDKEGTTILDRFSVQDLNWGVILILGGGMVLAEGFTVTGLSAWIGYQLNPLGAMPAFFSVLLLFLIVSMFTEFVSNSGAATILVPIAARLAQGNNCNPLLFVVPTALATSLAFVLPTSTPPNTITLSTGAFAFSEMNKTGVFMDVIAVVAASVVFFAFGVPVLGIELSGGLPAWASA